MARKAKKIRIISVPDRKTRLLAEKFGVSEGMVYSALGGRTHSEKASQICEAALSDFGGVETQKLVWE